MLISDDEFQPADRKKPIINKLDVQHVLRDGRQTVIGIRYPATIKLTDSDETLPESFIVINEQKPERRKETYFVARNVIAVRGGARTRTTALRAWRLTGIRESISILISKSVQQRLTDDLNIEP